MKRAGQLSFTLPLQLCLQALTMVSGHGAMEWGEDVQDRVGTWGLLSAWPVL